MRDLVQFIERACRTSWSVAEAEIVHVGEIGKTIGNESGVAAHGRDALQMQSPLLCGIEILGVVGGAIEPSEDIRHPCGASLEIGEVGILRQARERREATPAKTTSRFADGQL